MENSKNKDEINLDLNLPPLEALLFVPERENIFKVLDDNIYESSYWSLDNKNINPQPSEIKRKIFDNKENWLLYELNSLKEVNKQLDYNISSNFTDGEKLRFLHSANFDIKETVSLIKNTNLFKLNYKDILNNPPNVIFEILNTGAIYINGRDCDYRPIVIFDLKKYNYFSSKFELDNWLEAIVYLCNYIIKNLLLPGIVETWNIFLNLDGASMISVSGDLRVMISLMQNNFKGRLNQIYIFKMSMLFNILLKIVFKMYPFVEKKLRIIDEENRSTLLYDNICIDQMEKRFFGIRRDLNDISEGESYFPLKLIENDKIILKEEWELKNYVNYRESEVHIDNNLNSNFNVLIKEKNNISYYTKEKRSYIYNEGRFNSKNDKHQVYEINKKPYISIINLPELENYYVSEMNTKPILLDTNYTFDNDKLLISKSNVNLNINQDNESNISPMLEIVDLTVSKSRFIFKLRFFGLSIINKQIKK